MKVSLSFTKKIKSDIITNMSNFEIYVHIPFCIAKCKYCSFVSAPAEKEEMERYVNFLCAEIKQKSNLFNDKLCTSIYFGGGTPSLIDEKLIQKILNTIKNNYKISKNAEISIECNPCTINKKKLINYLNFGINRISFGVQSFCENELKSIGRLHNVNEAKNAIKMAKEVGFNNISADIMIGIPNQTKESLNKTINEVVELDVNHISCYMLMLEENTPLFEEVINGKVSVASEDECVQMYNMVYEQLKQRGYDRYEISNFAKTGFECKHNLGYWNLSEYIGFGVSAHSYYNNRRIANSDKMEDYLCYKNITIEELSNEQKVEEMIMLGLRCSSGVDINELKKLGFDIINEKYQEIKQLKDGGLIVIENNRIKVTPNNFGVCSAIILKLI